MPLPPSPFPPPQNIDELLQRSLALNGLTLRKIADQYGLDLPENLNSNKGWTGQLLEFCLGADSFSLPQPDFDHLGIELKSLPVDSRGRPKESTYICHIPLLEEGRNGWEASWVYKKLKCILWIPVEGERSIPLAERHIGRALLWSPSESEMQQLKEDWLELSEMIMLGEVESITAHMGVVLQIRPKAANAAVRCEAYGQDGEIIQTNPRGYYLRPAFTRSILEQHFF